jgi:NTE family protein
MLASLLLEPSRGFAVLGLTLTAGGARGAYQAGVLKRIGEIPAFHARPMHRSAPPRAG